MRKNFKIMLILVLILLMLASAGAYVILTPHYETININGLYDGSTWSKYKYHKC